MLVSYLPYIKIILILINLAIGKAFQSGHSVLYGNTYGETGTSQWQVRRGIDPVKNTIRIINERIRKLPWRGLSCKKLKMGNICPRDKVFTQYLVCLLRDWSIQF